MSRRPRQPNSCPGPKTKTPKTPASPTPRQRELTTKRRGELSELAFAHKAVDLGFAVSKPYGDSERYDFILAAGPTLHRVQVKSSTHILCGLYHVNAHRRTQGTAVPYLLSEVDFLAAHIIPEDAWFILPMSLILDRTSLLFAPKNYYRGPGLYGPYREAWHLFREPRLCPHCNHTL